MYKVKIRQFKKWAKQRKEINMKKKEPWRKWKINRFRTSKTMNITLTNHSKFRKCIIISQEALSHLVRYLHTIRRKFLRLRLRFKPLNYTKMTTSMRIFTFLHRKRIYMMIPPILEEVRAMDLNLIPLRYLPGTVYLTEKKSLLLRKRSRDRNRLPTSQVNPLRRANHRVPYLLKPLALIKNILRYLKTILMT